VAAPFPALAATDSAAIGKCLLQKCRLPLARCVTDPVCAANLLCIQTCTGKPDESECQIKCGDEFSNDVVGAFTTCAVSEKKCVPQRQDDGSWPVPKEEALVESFSPSMFTGNWYITAGLNPAFDIFDCQLHKFSSPAGNKFVGDLQWRIKNALVEQEFDTRTTIQEFVQDPKVPGILYNHDNEFLHYEDDWYILAAKEDAYFVVYYRGNNDAWDGYGGAVVYTRSSKFPKEYSKEIDASLQKIGRSLKDFQYTNNTCKGKPTKTEDLVFVESRVATGINSVETSFAKELTKDIKIVEDDIVKVEKVIEKDVVAVEKEIEKDVVAVEKVIEKDVIQVEEEIVRDEKKVENLFKSLFK
jgi:violaxanthin de-epoxidase